LVLVDLVHGAAVSRRFVAELNLRRRETRVLALHDGGFGDDPALVDLSVDGFCRLGSWESIAGALATCGHSSASH
jgi:hypothetical protein